MYGECTVMCEVEPWLTTPARAAWPGAEREQQVARPAASACAMAKVRLRFLFANHDGLSKTIEFDMDTPASRVKTRIMEEWPEELEAVTDVRRFRLLCMGKELPTGSTKSLRSLGIPTYETHPTPVNVSILPNTFATPTNEAGKSSSLPPVEGCCVVM